MSKFKIGDTAWHGHCIAHQRVKKQCPICAGKLKVTLILGDESQVILPCQGCTTGYDPPTGFVTEYEYSVEPKFIVIDGVTVESTANGDKVTYRSDCRVFDDTVLFNTKEEAFEFGKKLKLELETEQSERAELIKKNQNKSYSWNARYHLREVAEAKKRIEYHEKMATICKSRSKEEINQKGEQNV